LFLATKADSYASSKHTGSLVH